MSRTQCPLGARRNGRRSATESSPAVQPQRLADRASVHLGLDARAAVGRARRARCCSASFLVQSHDHDTCWAFNGRLVTRSRVRVAVGLGPIATGDRQRLGCTVRSDSTTFGSATRRGRSRSWRPRRFKSSQPRRDPGRASDPVGGAYEDVLGDGRRTVGRWSGGPRRDVNVGRVIRSDCWGERCPATALCPDPIPPSEPCCPTRSSTTLDRLRSTLMVVHAGSVRAACGSVCSRPTTGSSICSTPPRRTSPNAAAVYASCSSSPGLAAAPRSTRSSPASSAATS